jgi:hypothetical protein
VTQQVQQQEQLAEEASLGARVTGSSPSISGEEEGDDSPRAMASGDEAVGAGEESKAVGGSAHGHIDAEARPPANNSSSAEQAEIELMMKIQNIIAREGGLHMSYIAPATRYEQ